MNIQNIIYQLNSFIRERYHVAENDMDFNENVHLFDYGYIDSFGVIDLIQFVENHFKIKINDNDLVITPLNTINEIAIFIEKRSKGEI